MKRALSSFLLLLLIAAPSAPADGFREAEVRKALDRGGLRERRGQGRSGRRGPR